MGVFSRTAALVALGAVLLFPGSVAAEEGGADSVGGKAPDFAGDDLNGGKVSLDGMLKEKKLVVLNFWGLRCSACLEEMPHLDGIAKEFGPKGVQVVGVNVDGAPAPLLKKLMDKSELRPGYPVVADPEMAIADAYRLTGAPLTVIVDACGTVRYRHVNYAPGDEKEFRAKIIKLLAEK
jgi:peroxiredoxin